MKKPRPPSRSAKPVPAGHRAPTYDDLLAIARLIESGSRFSEFRLKSGDIEVEVKRANGNSSAQAQAEIGPRTSAATAASGATVAPAQAGAQSPNAAAPGTTQVPSDATLIKSPMVGTFYRSPAPDKPPFVEVGTRVKADTIVCIIEVMKLMNSVPAGVEGVVTHVLAQNAQAVEYGQPLIAIRPK